MIAVKYIVVTLGLVLAINNLFAQGVETSNFQNFFGLKEDFQFGGQTQFEKISLDNQIVAFRRYGKDDFILAEEYIHYKNDTFLLLEYSNSDHHISSYGKVVPSLCCKNIDTTYIFDLQTLKDKMRINKYWDWSKEGVWEIDNPVYRESGNYKNNLKAGEWYYWDKKNRLGKYIYFDTAGTQIFEEPQNLIQTQNRERIIKGLIGTWKIEENNERNLRLLKETEPGNLGTYGNLDFDSKIVKFTIQLKCATGFDFENFKKRSQNSWTIEEDNILSMNVYSFENKKFKITYLSRNEMYLEAVQK